MPKKVLVAEGDSWFAVPDMTVSVIGIKGTDVIDELEKLEDTGNVKRYNVKLLANHGDKLASLDEKCQFYEFAETLLQLENPLCAILLSGGGNDIPKNLYEMLNDKDSSAQNSSNYLNKSEVNKIINGLRCEYLKLLTKINNLCAALFDLKNKIPVLIHGYAYPVPDGRQFKLEFHIGFGDFTIEKRGPWLQPIFKKKGYDVRGDGLARNTKIMEELIDQFNCMIYGLDPNNKSFSHIYVQHVDVRQLWANNLQNNDYHKYWADEFHPTKKGFELIADKFDKVIQGLGSIPV